MKNRKKKTNQKEIFYTWQAFDNDVKFLFEKYAIYKGMLKNIYGIPRGGLVLAVKLSNLLNIPLITKKREINKYTLIVDEIYDTGKTIKDLIYGKKYFSIAVLFANEENIKNIKLPLVIKRLVKSDSCISFPWEREVNR